MRIKTFSKQECKELKKCENAKIKYAKEILYNNTPSDRIIDTYVDKDFVEFLVRCGGDNCTYRIYNDGKIYCK